MMVRCTRKRMNVSMAIAAVMYKATAVLKGRQGRQVKAVLEPYLQVHGTGTSAAQG